MRIELDIHWVWVVLFAGLFFVSLVLRISDLIVTKHLAKREEDRDKTVWSRPDPEQSFGRVFRSSPKAEAPEFPFNEED